MKYVLIGIAVWFLAQLYFGVQICSNNFKDTVTVSVVHPLKVECLTPTQSNRGLVDKQYT